MLAALMAFGLGCGSSTGASQASIATAASPNLVEALRTEAHPIRSESRDLSTVVDWIGDASIVLLGEATHGTHEFYKLRAEITKALITKGDLDAVAIEGDWTSAGRVDRYVRGLGSDASAAQALSDFERFPRWMWRNEVVADFVEWLREHNEPLPMSERVGFHGLDVYDPAGSAAAVVAKLSERSPAAADRARARYGCLLSEGDEASQMIRGLAAEPDCLGELKTQLQGHPRGHRR